MSSEKNISVIIPAYNSVGYLNEAIESVLQQTIAPREIIVVDDGSTDETKSVIRNFDDRVRYLYQKRSGVAAARNKGLELSRGDLITFIDADDIWKKSKLEIQVKRLRKNPELEMVIGFLQRVTTRSKDHSLKVYDGDEDGIYVLQLGSTLIKKSVFTKVGNFDEEMRLSEDFDWFLRARESGIKVDVHQDVVQYYRQHDKNTTGDTLAANRYLLKAFKKSIDRRKNAGLTLTESNVPGPKNDINEILNFWNYKDRK